MSLPRRAILFFLFLCGCPHFAAAAVRAVLESPSGVLLQDAPVSLALLLTNDGDAPATQKVPAGLGLVARVGARSEAFTLMREAGTPAEVTIGPKSYVRVLYSGALPAGLSGFIVLQDRAGRWGAVALQVTPDAPRAETGFAEAGAASPTTGDALPDEAEIAGATKVQARTISDLGLMAYEPIYFSVGGGGGSNARFQFSFKYRPFGPGDDHIAGTRWWQDVYFAFTQTSVWDLHSESNPFYDSSYRPSVSYGRHELGSKILGAAFGYSAGLEHESNGKDGVNSRSLNVAFFRPEFRWGDLEADRWRVVFAPRFYAYLEKSDNRDIADYRGYGDYELSVEWKDGVKIAARTRLGMEGHASLLVDASYPFNRINDIVPIGWAHGYLHLQFFSGYGETLLDYNRRDDTQVRLGFMLVR